MKTFPANIRFKYNWRKYQQRVLDDLSEHIADKHLHVIAPPGSGKTVLGLEVALRLNQPTLILAPTIAIRNQWIQRFTELFLQTISVPDWISRDIKNPKFLTISTYQGLHAACNNLKFAEDESSEEEEPSEETNNIRPRNQNNDSVISSLKQQDIRTIIVDEAHHLKNEWWHTLSVIKKSLDPTIVGLTATPPYDVTASEWQRYIELNGPVDTEISVPELVSENDLCPHQDYIHFTFPTGEEFESIIRFRNNIDMLFEQLRHDDTLIEAILSHPAWKHPLEHLEWIYNNISYYSACLIYLHNNSIEIPETHLDIIGDIKTEIPQLDFEWMETLLNFYLYKETIHFLAFEEHQKSLEKRLRKFGALERKQISFFRNKRVSGFLSSSIGKLNSIKTIVDFEFSQLKSNLRMVILSDYIRKEFLQDSATNDIPLSKIGVIPIFEKIRRENPENIKIGVLTGSIIIIPASALDAFKAKAAKYNIHHISSTPLSYDNRFILIHQTEQIKHDVVHIVTQIFQQGAIEVLIGTKSLLGEGWDAPAINSLILASFVGSFVLSNQMRGRAIRTQKDNPEKTGNIWHIVCIDPTAPEGGDDLRLMKRRFRSFVGVSFRDEPTIENGIGRLNLPDDIRAETAIEEKNKEMFAFAADRENLKQRWNDALATGVNLVEEIKIPFPKERNYRKIKSLYFDKTLANLSISLMIAFMGFFSDLIVNLIRSAVHIRSLKELYAFLFSFIALGLFYFGRKTYKFVRLYIQYRDIAKDIRSIGKALIHALHKSGVIHTDLSTLEVESSVDIYGGIYCHLNGGTAFDKSVFINSLQEIISPIHNPRYVIIRKSRMLFIQQRDYHAVPELLGRNKALSEFFHSQWETFVGKSELIFTRNIEGRKMLLKARIHALSAQLTEEETEHVNKWR